MANSQQEIAKLKASGWTDQQITEYAALDAEEASLNARIQDVAEQEKAFKESPEYKFSAKRAANAAKKVELAQRERDLADDAVWEKLKAERGENRVARVRTVEGSIFLRALSLKEVDPIMARVAALVSDYDKTRELRELTLSSVVHPPIEDVRKLVDQYPSLMSALVEARDALISGVREETAKKG